MGKLSSRRRGGGERGGKGKAWKRKEGLSGVLWRGEHLAPRGFRKKEGREATREITG